MDQGALGGKVSHRADAAFSGHGREVDQKAASPAVQALANRFLRQLLKAGAVAAGVLLQIINRGRQG
jgi:hypothetical protein